MLQKLREECYDKDLYRVLAGKNFEKPYEKRKYHKGPKVVAPDNNQQDDEYDSMDVRKDVKCLLDEAMEKNFPDLIP